jgi:hypothetical protein
MITGGKYSVWFRTPIGEGAGVVDFQPNGKLSGGAQRSLTPGIGRRTASASRQRCPPGGLRPGRPVCSEWTQST